MNHKISIYFFLLSIFLSSIQIAQAFDRQPRTGFLVVAPDRGFLGNREVKILFESFAQNYRASLAFVEREYGGPDRSYEIFLKDSLNKLEEQNLDRVIVISLFLTQLNPVVQDIHNFLRDYKPSFVLEWAEPMVKSYLIAQILYDRIIEISKDPINE